MTHILHRAANAMMPVAVGGRGIELFDPDGKSYIDASGGAAVSCLGHGHPDVLAALHKQLDALAYAHTGFFTTEVAERLADRLIEDAPQGIDHVYLVSGGSEAIEAALKMARQYFVEKGETAAPAHHRAPPELSRQYAGGAGDRRQRMAPRAIPAAADRNPSYRPLLCLSPAGGRRKRRRLCGARRTVARRQDPRTRARSGHRLRRRDGRRRDAGRGAAGRRLFQAHPRDLRPLWRAADSRRSHVRHGAHRNAACLRAGRRRARSDGDRQGLGRRLSAGRRGAAAASKIFEAFSKGSGFFQHGHTYMGHPMAAAAGLAVQEVIRRDSLLDNVVAMGEPLQRRLEERLGNHHHVGDIRGRGLFRAVELVADRRPRRPSRRS